MDDVIKLLGVMMAIMIPVAVGGGVFVLIANVTRRLKGSRVPISPQELRQLRARVEELELGQRQVGELAERLDFVERMLPALREGRALPAARSSSDDTPPVA